MILEGLKMENNEKATVLIVDDSPTNIRILAEDIKEYYQIKIAKDAKQAFNVANSDEQPDLILLDIMMPDVDGYEVCKILKKNKATKDIPVIFVSALDQDHDEEYGLSLGAIDYISKPFNEAVVKVRVKNHIKLKQYSDELKRINMLDGLTKVTNKNYFNEQLLKDWDKAKKNKKNISIFMMDIDFFKRFNDTYGHLKGDECLKKSI